MRTKSQDEIEARLNLAQEVLIHFPFLKDRFRINSHLFIDEQGVESGTLSVEIFSVTADGEITLESTIEKMLSKVISEDLLKQNKRLRVENKKLKSIIKEHEKEVQTRGCVAGDEKPAV